QQITIEADLVAVADCDHCDSGLADLGECVHLRYGQLDATDVDDQDVGRALLTKMGDCLGDTAPHDRAFTWRQLSDAFLQLRLGLAVGDEGKQGRPAARLFGSGSPLDRRGGFEDAPHNVIPLGYSPVGDLANAGCEPASFILHADHSVFTISPL